MRIIFAALWALAAWKWGDWRNWNKYYSTILFYISVNLATSIITTNHRLWVLTDTAINTSQTVNAFLDAFIIFPATILLYLPYFPKELNAQIVYIAKWVFIYGILEYTVIFVGLITYENGWSILWSILFDCVMFPIFAIHHRRPLIAWLLSAAFAIFVLNYFGFTLQMLQ